MRMRRTAMLGAVVAGFAMGSCSGDGATGNAPPVYNVTIAPADSVALLGLQQTIQLTATALGKLGKRLPSASITWTPGDPSVISVRPTTTLSGAAVTVTSVGRGRTTLTATAGGQTARVPVHVVAEVQAVTVNQPTLGLTELDTARVSAQVVRDPFVPADVRWTSSNATVATVPAAPVASGALVTVTAVAEGTATLTATSVYDATKQGTIAVTVTRGSIAKVVWTSPVPPQVAGGTPVVLSAQALDGSGRPLTGRTYTWRSEHPTAVGVTPTTPGSASANVQVRAALANVLPDTITVGADGASAVMVYQAIPIPVSKVDVRLATAALYVAQETTLIATATSATNDTLPNRRVAWASTNGTVATVDTTGRVTALAPGTTRFTATVAGVSDSSAVLTVTQAPVARVQVQLDSTTLVLGTTTQAHASLFDAGGHVLTGRPITWTSGQPAIATTGATGLVTAVAVGTATISATSEGVSGNATITVLPLPVVSVVVTGPTANEVGLTPAVFTVSRTGATTAPLTVYLQVGGSARNGGDYVAVPSAVTIAAGATSAPVAITPIGDALVEGNETIVLTVVDGAGYTAGTSSVAQVVLVDAPWGLGGSLTTGRYHSCALTTSDDAYCWGYNGNGQLGDGTQLNKLIPEPVKGGHKFVSLTSNNAHSCGLTSAGDAWCWGDNSLGQLGDGSTTDRAIPVQASPGRKFVQLTAGAWHTCGLASDGTAWCWGWNLYGQLGDNSILDKTSAVLVQGVGNFGRLSGGGYFTCGVTRDGIAYCWGGNGGQLGDSTLTQRNTPVPVHGGLTFGLMATGANHACGLRPSGVAYCWGDNQVGQLGDGTPIQRTTVPVPVSQARVFSLLTTSGNHTCGLEFNALAFCWGYNADGELGVGISGTPRTAPSQVQFGQLVALSAGNFHTCALTAQGKAWCWGLNQHGQLGDSTTISSSSPVRVGGGITFRVP